MHTQVQVHTCLDTFYTGYQDIVAHRHSYKLRGYTLVGGYVTDNSRRPRNRDMARSLPSTHMVRRDRGCREPFAVCRRPKISTFHPSFLVFFSLAVIASHGNPLRHVSLLPCLDSLQGLQLGPGSEITQIVLLSNYCFYNRHISFAY